MTKLLRNFFFRGCKKSSQLNKKEIQFQLKITNFINKTMFHSLQIVTRSSVVIKICKIFFFNMKEDIRLNLK